MGYLVNNQNLICFYDSATDRIVPLQSSSGSINVLVQTPLPQTYDYVYVQTTDYAASAYVTGSAGEAKTIKQYNTGDTGSNPARLSTFLYLDTNFPTKPTKMTETITTVA